MKSAGEVAEGEPAAGPEATSGPAGDVCKKEQMPARVAHGGPFSTGTSLFGPGPKETDAHIDQDHGGGISAARGRQHGATDKVPYSSKTPSFPLSWAL